MSFCICQNQLVSHFQNSHIRVKTPFLNLLFIKERRIGFVTLFLEKVSNTIDTDLIHKRATFGDVSLLHKMKPSSSSAQVEMCLSCKKFWSRFCIISDDALFIKISIWFDCQFFFKDRHIFKCVPFAKIQRIVCVSQVLLWLFSKKIWVGFFEASPIYFTYSTQNDEPFGKAGWTGA